MVEEAILEANDKNVKVLSLGLLNQVSYSLFFVQEGSFKWWKKNDLTSLSSQSEELNRNGEFYIQKYPKLKVKLVDGSSMAVAVILNSIPKEANKVLFRANLCKIAYAVVYTLCHKGIQVNKPKTVYSLRISISSYI